MKLQGIAYKLGNNINTDLVISGRYKFSITDLSELAKHLFEDIDPDFVKKIIPGKSIIVAGENFGMGSSREQAPLVIKQAGIIAVVAKNFARIFFRNAFNIGLPLVEADTERMKEKDEISIDLEKSQIMNLTQNYTQDAKPLPSLISKILFEGGMVNYFKKYGKLEI